MNRLTRADGPRLRRREALRLIGGGAALIAFSAAIRSGAIAAPLREAKETSAADPIIRTVLGDIDPASIQGIVLHHEHLGSGRPQPGKNARRPTEDIDWMTEEMVGIRTKYNIGCIVNALTGFPTAEVRQYLQELSKRSGVHIVLSGGYYMGPRYPADVATQSEDEIAGKLVEMAAEFGMGAYGEIGVANNTSDLSDVEKKVYRALGKAQAQNGLPIFTHASYGSGPLVPSDMALRQLDALEAGGADPKHILLGHIDCLFESDAHTAIACAKRNVYVGFDRLTRQQQMVSNENKVKTIMAFIRAGYVNSACFSSDYAGAIITSVGEVERQPGPYWFTDGGPGWARSVEWFDPLLRQAGMTEAQIHTIRYDNPRRWLAFTPRS